MSKKSRDFTPQVNLQKGGLKERFVVSLGEWPMAVGDVGQPQPSDQGHPGGEERS